MRILLLLLIGLMVSACTSKQLYNHAQGYKHSKCHKSAINIKQFDVCMQNENERMPYEDYEKLREQARKDSGKDSGKVTKKKD